MRHAVLVVTLALASLVGLVYYGLPRIDYLRPQIEAIELPAGYYLEWGGEYEDSQNAQAGLGRSLPVGFLLMILGISSGLLSTLPRAGAWMDRIKTFFGVGMLLIAAWFFYQAVMIYIQS